MAGTDDTLSVTRDDAAHRYVITVGDVPGGFAQWRLEGDDRVVFEHTVVDPAFSGRGVGSELVRAALADVADRGETAVAECPFVAKVMRDDAG